MKKIERMQYEKMKSRDYKIWLKKNKTESNIKDNMLGMHEENDEESQNNAQGFQRKTLE